MSDIDIDAGDIIALVALLIAIWTAWRTDRFNKRQTAFEATAERLNLLLIEKEAAETVAQNRADVSANFLKTGKSDYKLKVFNKGQGTATNVRFDVLDDSGLFIGSDIARKFPIPVLERHQFVELIAAVHMGSPSRAHIRLSWDDETGKDHAKELHPSW